MKKWLVVLLFVLGVTGAGALGWTYYAYVSFLETPLAVPPEGVDLTVAPGDNVTKLAKQLKRENFLKHTIWLKVLAKQESLTDIKKGRYHVATNTLPKQLLQRLVKGEVKQYSMTFIEGWRFKEWRDHLVTQEHIEHTTKNYSDAEIMAALGEPTRHPEGLFFPSTYQYEDGTTDLKILENARKRMKRIIKDEWDNRQAGLPYKTPYEALIMASIVEKETGAPHERAQIAGVFVRRLKKKMRLETDPTVIYGIGDVFDGNIKKRHLKEYTPYNTYRIKGLPPTPIAMPGKEAIHAALHPDDGDAIFFVSKGDGTHQFSVTLKEHNAAVRKYQLKKR